MSNSTASPRKDVSREKSIYFMTWRWHFYAGLYVIPFMIMLSLTGLVMLFDDEIEFARYHEILSVTPQETTMPVSHQLHAVQAAFPKYAVTQFVPAAESDLANRFSIQGPEGDRLLATVNPYTGEVLGTIDRGNSIYNIANDIHGTLLIGQWGDYLIEVSASLGILLLATGLYLWIPRDNASRAGFMKLRFGSGTRILMRDLHANLGGLLSVVLLVFLLSGLAWAGVWGAKMVQGWNTFPTYYTWGDRPESTMTHADLNHGAEEEMPWNLELAPVPESETSGHDHSAMKHDMPEALSANALNIDQIVDQAAQLGFTQYKVYFPKSETGVYTISANSMAGDVIDPRDDRTSHIDQYSGELLIDVTWEDYSVVAKLMAAGVSFHQGDIGIVNKLLNVFFCLAFIFISISGIVMWWIRRPSNKKALGAPPKFAQDGIWKTGAVTLVLICVMFPLAGASIAVALALDWLLFKRVEKLKHAFS